MVNDFVKTEVVSSLSALRAYKSNPSYFLQAIGNALCATGFGESIAGLLSENEIPNPWIERSVAAFVIVMLTLINLAGVKWVIRLQFLLLGILVLGAMDFGIGSFTHTNEGKSYILFTIYLKEKYRWILLVQGHVIPL